MTWLSQLYQMMLCKHEADTYSSFKQSAGCFSLCPSRRWSYISWFWMPGYGVMPRVEISHIVTPNAHWKHNNRSDNMWRAGFARIYTVHFNFYKTLHSFHVMQYFLTTSLFTVNTLSARLSTAIHFTGILAILPCL